MGTPARQYKASWPPVACDPMTAPSFRLIATEGTARCGEIATPHGPVATPAFMPVGTQGTVKALAPQTLRAAGADIERAMRLSLRWAERSRRVFAAKGGLFGIVQGGDDLGLRSESLRALVDIGFDGYAIGGLAVGESQEVTLRVVGEVAPALPAHAP